MEKQLIEQEAQTSRPAGRNLTVVPGTMAGPAFIAVGVLLGAAFLMQSGLPTRTKHTV